ncbi:MAG: hypothetical protein AAGJ93_08430, partial [Bacteroidota bacterium]
TNEDGCINTRSYELEPCFDPVYVDDDETDNPLLVGYSPTYEDFNLQVRGGLFLEDAMSATASLYVISPGDGTFSLINPSEYYIQWHFQGELLAENTNEIEVSRSLVEGSAARLLVTVSNGCIEQTVVHPFIFCGSDEYDQVLSEYFVTSYQDACNGINNGQIVLGVDNPEHMEISVSLSGQNASQGSSTIFNGSSDGTESFSSFFIDLLSEDDYDIVINIGDCEHSFTHAIGNSGAENIFRPELSSSEDETCHYDLICDGINVGHELQAASRVYASGASFPCRVPVACGSTFLGEKEIDVIKLRAAEAYDFLTSINAYSSDIFPNIDAEITSLGLELGSNGVYTGPGACKVVKICPANMQIEFSGFGGIFLGVTNTNGDDCVTYQCLPLPFTFTEGGSYQYCVDGAGGTLASNVLDDLTINVSHDVSADCYSRVSAHIAALAKRFEMHPDDFPDDFEETRLYEIIMEDYYYGTDERAYCAKVTYCLENLNLIYHNDISTVNCGSMSKKTISYNNQSFSVSNTCQPYAVPGASHNQSETFSDENWLGYSVFCDARAEDGSIIQVPYAFYRGPGFLPLRTIGNGWEDVPDSENTHNITSGGANEELLSMGYNILGEGVKVAKGIVNTQGQTDYYDFQHAVGDVHKIRNISNDLQFIVQDWSTEESVFINKTEDNNFVLEFQSDSGIWSVPITSSDSELTIKDLFYENGEIKVIGATHSSVFIDEVQVYTLPEASIFVLSFSNTGELRDYKTISGVEEESVFLNVNDDQKLSILAQATEADIRVNGITTTAPTAGGWLAFELENEVTSMATEKSMIMSDAALEIANYTTSKGGKLQTYYFPKTGEAGVRDIYLTNTSQNGNDEHTNVDVTSNGAEASLLVNINAAGELAWMKKLNEENGEIHELLFDYDEERNLYVAITFSGSISFGQLYFHSAGSTDIVVLKITEAGEVKHRKYGTPDPESATEILVSNEGVYLGGTFSGGTNPRQIG